MDFNLPKGYPLSKDEKLLLHCPKFRELHQNPLSSSKIVPYGSRDRSTYRIAALVYHTGIEKTGDERCAACQAKPLGPYLSCVVADGVQDGACSNCVHFSFKKRCSFVKLAGKGDAGEGGNARTTTPAPAVSSSAPPKKRKVAVDVPLASTQLPSQASAGRASPNIQPNPASGRSDPVKAVMSMVTDFMVDIRTGSYDHLDCRESEATILALTRTGHKKAKLTMSETNAHLSTKELCDVLCYGRSDIDYAPILLAVSTGMVAQAAKRSTALSPIAKEKQRAVDVVDVDGEDDEHH